MITHLGDPSFDPERGEACVLFDGSAEACLAALRVGRHHPVVHLLAGVARGVSGAAALAFHVQRLGRFYGDPTRYRLHVLDVQPLLDELRRAVPPPGRVQKASVREPLAAARAGAAAAFAARCQAVPVADGLSRKHCRGSLATDAALEALGSLHAAVGQVAEHPVLDEGEDDVDRALWLLRYARGPKRVPAQEKCLVSDWHELQAVADRASTPGDEVGSDWYRAMLQALTARAANGSLDALLKEVSP